MEVAKKLAACFLVGGLFGLITQVLGAIWAAILGPESVFLTLATLVTLGVIGGIMFAFGWHQKVQAFGGWGAMFPFNGFCAACAHTYAASRNGEGTYGAATWAVIKETIIIAGLGIGIVAIMTIAVAFIAG